MGKMLSSMLGMDNDFQANNGGQNFQGMLSNAQGNYQQAFQGQNGLAQALQQQASGNGANPAQGMLNQATDKGMAQNAALIASSKGINPALAQRLAAQNHANMSQEAAGQGAVLGAQQQLAAQGQLSGLYGQMGNQALNSQNITQGGLNAANTINSGVAQQNTQMAGQIVGGLAQGISAGAASGATGDPTKAIAKHAHGGFIDGPEVVKGDSLKNDVVHAMLSPGEIVIPKSKASDPAKAKAFIDHIMKSEGGGDEDQDVSYGHVLELKRRIASLEKKVGSK